MSKDAATAARSERFALVEAGQRSGAARAQPPPRARRRWVLPLLFLAPSVVLLLLVVAYPIIYSVYVSLHETDYMRIGDFVGLSLYSFLLQDPLFWRNAAVTVKYVLGSLAGAIPLGLVLALILDQDLPGSGFFRTVCALPWVISQTVAALLWLWLLDPSFGPVNYLITAAGLQPVNFTSTEGTALAVLIGVNVWMSYPFAMILLSAGLQTIPKDLYDAAKIDGASGLSTFFSVTLPLLRSTLLSTCIMLTLYYFTMVTLILILTGGGPVRSTEILSLRVFNETFLNWRIGYASALGVMIFLLNAIFSLLYIKLARGRTEL